MTIYVGFDPEVFLKNKDGKFISAVGLVGGSKEHPKSIGNGCYVQEDNVAVEFNTPPVDVFEDKAAEKIKGYFQYVMDWLEENVCKPNGLVIATEASAIFDDDQLQTEAAKTFGCDPDYNAYTGQENSKPIGPQGLRTCGGHIHVGYGNCNKELNKYIIKYLDQELGLHSVLEDTDSRRRILYGKAGAYRDKSYGVEYRTLSNYWINDIQYFKRIVKVISSLGYDEDEFWSAFEQSALDYEDMDEAVQHTINNNDVVMAKTLLKELESW